MSCNLAQQQEYSNYKCPECLRNIKKNIKAWINVSGVEKIPPHCYWQLFNHFNYKINERCMIAKCSKCQDYYDNIYPLCESNMDKMHRHYLMTIYFNTITYKERLHFLLENDNYQYKIRCMLCILLRRHRYDDVPNNHQWRGVNYYYRKLAGYPIQLDFIPYKLYDDKRHTKIFNELISHRLVIKAYAQESYQDLVDEGVKFNS